VPYSARISRENPTCVLFVIDQSGSMSDRGQSGTKADDVAKVVNRTLHELINRASLGPNEDDLVWDYFDVGVIGYGAQGADNALSGPLNDSLIQPISALYHNPLRIDDVKKRESDGAGGIIEISTKLPIWFEATADGGTPMCQALTLAATTLADWADTHPSSFPPVVMHLTDGESTDGDPQPIAQQLQRLSTEDGEVILMNMFFPTQPVERIPFPASDSHLDSEFGKVLFRMSSPLSGEMSKAARERGYSLSDGARAFMVASPQDAGALVALVDFFEIGTRASNLR
jgi:hypothetical protein